MIYCEDIEAYIRFVRTHPEEVNEERKLLIENIVIPTLNDPEVVFDAEMFEKCKAYCEKHYFPLFPFQKFIYAFVFMYKDDEVVFSTFFCLEGRGNGKTSGFMPLMNFLQTPLHGIKNYHVDIVANSEDQAKEDFNIVYEMLEDNKNRFKKHFFWTKEIIKNLQTRSEIRYNTSNAKTKDGKKAGAVLFDEYHAYETYDQVNVFGSQMGKVRHARKFIITTQGYVRDGVLDDTLRICEQVLASGENEIGYFPFICKLDSREEVDDKEKWKKANPSLEFMPTLRKQIERDYLEMKRLSSKRPEFMTKRMNLPDRNDEVTVASWEDILASTVDDPMTRKARSTPDLKNKPCVIGIDYADIRDFASAGLLFKVDGEYIWRQHTWICKNSPFFESIKFPFNRYGEEEYQDFEIVDERSLSAAAIVQWCMEQMQEYQVQKIVMDTYRFSLFREAFEQMGVPIESKKNPYGLVRMIRHVGSINTLTAPLIEVAFVDHAVNFGASAIMRWFTNNTSVHIDKLGNKSYGKIEPKLRKNDGFMAFVVAMSCEKLLDEQILII